MPRAPVATLTQMKNSILSSRHLATDTSSARMEKQYADIYLFSLIVGSMLSWPDTRGRYDADVDQTLMMNLWEDSG